MKYVVDSMDARDRVMHGAITEEIGLQGLKFNFPHQFSKPIMGVYIANYLPLHLHAQLNKPND